MRRNKSILSVTLVAVLTMTAAAWGGEVNPFTGKKVTAKKAPDAPKPEKMDKAALALPPPLPPVTPPQLPSQVPQNPNAPEKKERTSSWTVIGIVKDMVSLVDANDKLLIVPNGEEIGKCLVVYPTIECNPEEMAKLKRAVAKSRSDASVIEALKKERDDLVAQNKKLSSAPAAQATAVAQAPSHQVAAKQPKVAPTWFDVSRALRYSETPFGVFDAIVEHGNVQSVRIESSSTRKFDDEMKKYIREKADDGHYAYYKLSGLSVRGSN